MRLTRGLDERCIVMCRRMYCIGHGITVYHEIKKCMSSPAHGAQVCMDWHVKGDVRAHRSAECGALFTMKDVVSTHHSAEGGMDNMTACTRR